MLRLVGSTVPPADLIPAREFENGGQHDIFEAGAALVELVELPGAPVAIQAEDEGGGGVGEAPIYATDDLRPDGIRARIAQMSLRGGVEAVDEALEGDKQTFDLLQREGATVAKLRDVVGREVPGVDVGSGAKERMTGAGPLLEVQPEAVAATGRAGCPSGGADAALPEASFEDLPGVIAGEGRFVEPEPGEIEAAHGIGSIQGAKEDLGAAGERQMAGGLVIGGDEAGWQDLKEGALGRVVKHGIGGRADKPQRARIFERAQDRANGSGGGLAGADAAHIEREARGRDGERRLHVVHIPAPEEIFAGGMRRHAGPVIRVRSAVGVSVVMCAHAGCSPAAPGCREAVALGCGAEWGLTAPLAAAARSHHR